MLHTAAERETATEGDRGGRGAGEGDLGVGEGPGGGLFFPAASRASSLSPYAARCFLCSSAYARRPSDSHATCRRTQACRRRMHSLLSRAAHLCARCWLFLAHVTPTRPPLLRQYVVPRSAHGRRFSQAAQKDTRRIKSSFPQSILFLSLFFFPTSHHQHSMHPHSIHTIIATPHHIHLARTYTTPQILTNHRPRRAGVVCTLPTLLPEPDEVVRVRLRVAIRVTKIVGLRTSLTVESS